MTNVKNTTPKSITLLYIKNVSIYVLQMLYRMLIRILYIIFELNNQPCQANRIREQLTHLDRLDVEQWFKMRLKGDGGWSPWRTGWCAEFKWAHIRPQHIQDVHTEYMSLSVLFWPILSLSVRLRKWNLTCMHPEAYHMWKYSSCPPQKQYCDHVLLRIVITLFLATFLEYVLSWETWY